MSAVKEHLEQVDDPLVTPEELAYDALSQPEKTVGADMVDALYPPLRKTQPKVVAPREIEPRRPAVAPVRLAPQPVQVPERPPVEPPRPRISVPPVEPPRVTLEPDEFEPLELPKVAGLGATSRRRKADELLERDPPQTAEKTAEYLWQSHAILTSTAFIRASGAEALVGRTITPMLRHEHARGGGKGNPNDVVLVLDEPIESPNQFQRLGGAYKTASLLTWTSKMDCPSFGLPAGPTGSGLWGSCPGAVGGQSLLAGTAQQEKQQKNIVAVHNKADKRRLEQLHEGPKAFSWAEVASVNLADCVCQSCYAEKNNYQYMNRQLDGLVRLAWADAAVENGSFVAVLDYAVKHADYFLDGREGGPPERIANASNPNEPGRFFRIHDSGDFFSEAYYKAWCEVAALNPDVTFWAPTRIWALSPDRKQRDHESEKFKWLKDTPPPENLIVRPSTYMFNRPAALLEHLQDQGYAAPTTSYQHDAKKPRPLYHPDGYPYHWSCQAYEGKKTTCRHALNPQEHLEGLPATSGCRACWIYPNLSINYRKH